MEAQKPHEIINRCLEARWELTQYPAVESFLIERVAQFPDDDFCSQSREALQLGAGYAYLHKNEIKELEAIFTGFFTTRPQNRYRDPASVEIERKSIVVAALELLESGTLPELEACIDTYEVEAASAFVEGYLRTIDGLQ